MDFFQRFAVIGPAENCIQKLSALRQLGVDRMFIVGPREDHFGAEVDRAQERFVDEVIPALAYTRELIPLRPWRC